MRKVILLNKSGKIVGKASIELDPAPGWVEVTDEEFGRYALGGVIRGTVYTPPMPTPSPKTDRELLYEIANKLGVVTTREGR